MANQNDLSRSVVAFEQHNTIIAVIEMSLNSWLVAGIVPGIERHPLKKLSLNEEVLLKLLHRWRDEAVKAGHTISRIVVAFEAGRDIQSDDKAIDFWSHPVRHFVVLLRRCGGKQGRGGRDQPIGRTRDFHRAGDLGGERGV